MKAAIVTALLLGGFLPVRAEALDTTDPQLSCETGPISRTFGGTEWLVYSCDDRRSLVVVSAERNPAAPFVFVLTPKAGGYTFSGEGNGDKRASSMAGDQLSQLSAEQVADLIAATAAARSRNVR